ncbi:energy transducer TonB [bacterium]|nr:energy transducer TonB [bacterium]
MVNKEAILASKTTQIYLSRYYLVKSRIKEKRRKQRHKYHYPDTSSKTLKPVKLNNEEISFLHAIKSESEKLETRRLITPNRFSVSVSLLIHVIISLFAAFIFIEGKKEIESYVEVDFTEAEPRPKLRRLRFSRAPTIQPIQENIDQKQQFIPKFVTMVDIPIGKADYLLSVGNFSSNLDISKGTPMREISTLIQPLNRIVQPKRLKPKITLAAPKTEILNQIESSVSQTAELNLATMTLPTTSLPSDVIEPPKFIYKVVPKYPDLARRAEKEGIVILSAEIGIDGQARDIKVVQELGYGFEEAAIEALKNSRFLPARHGQKPISAIIQIPYRFQFEA